MLKPDALALAYAYWAKSAQNFLGSAMQNTIGKEIGYIDRVENMNARYRTRL